MEQHGFAAGRRVLHFLPPFANQFPHVGLGSAEFLDLLPERMQFLFGQMEHALAGYAAIVASPHNVRKLSEGKAELECSLYELNTLDRRWREYTEPPTRPLRSRENADPLVVAERVGADTGKTGEFARAQTRSTHTGSMHPRIGSRVKFFLSVSPSTLSATVARLHQRSLQGLLLG